MHGFPEPRSVLHEERPVEPIDVADLRDPRIGRVISGKRHRNIAGHQLQQPEHD